jgi:hypothetical protein
MSAKKNLITLLVVAVIGIAATAEARHVRFMGPHPISAKYGGGYCYIEAPHLHIYPPDHPALYQQVGDDYVFTGDPTPFGYDGEHYQFYGHHPTQVPGVYCLIDGPHFHPYPIPSTPEFRVQSDVGFYVGPLPEEYERQRVARERPVNEAYQPYVALRPQVVVQPPPEWHGRPYVAVQAPSVEVQAPGVVVEPPRPPGVIIEPPRPPGVIIEPPRPPGVVVVPPHPPGVIIAHPPGVIVAPPHPPGVVIGVPAPGVVVGVPAPGVVVGAPGVVVEGGGHLHHDNGVRRHGGKR